MNIDEYFASLEGDENTDNEVIDDNEDMDVSDVDIMDEPDDQDVEPDDEEPEIKPDEKAQDEDTSEPENIEAPDKKVQTPEENARFAEQRRQQQLEQKLQEELQKRPEYQMAQMLSEMYGKPVDQLYQELQEARMQKEAKERNVPIEVLREQERQKTELENLRMELNMSKFQAWQGKVEADKAKLLTDYPMLTENDLNQSVDYLLTGIRNPDIPLEQAVFALHGAKITSKLRELAKTEALAEISGRSKSPLPPANSGKGDLGNELTDEEKYVAQQMGISEAEYKKWKS